MAETKYANLLQKRMTADEWAASNPLLLEGQFGLDTTSGIVKLGNGRDLWLDLPVLNVVLEFDPATGLYRTDETANPIVSVYEDEQLPDGVRATLASNLSNPDTPEGAAVAASASPIDPNRSYRFGEPLFMRGSNGEDGVVLKPKGDGHTAAWQLLHNDSAGFVTHIVSGPDMSSDAGPGGLSGWGVGTPGIVGLVVDVSAEAVGQQNICFAPVGPAGVAHQVSTLGPAKALKVNQSADAGVTAGVALTVTAENPNPNADQKLLELRTVALAGGAAEAGATIMSVYAKTGRVELSSPITQQNGGKFVVTTYDPFGNNDRSRTTMKGSTVTLSGETGSGNLMWSHRLRTNSTELQFQSAGAAAEGSETWVTNLRMTDGRIGFFGAAPVQRPARPTDLAGVISALTTLGLIA